MSTPNDEKLFRDYLDGRAEAFELLVRRYTNELFQFVLRFTNDSVAAEDVVQETFLQVHTAADSFDLRRKFKPWLFTIAANKARDHLRRRTRRSELPIDAVIHAADDGGKRFIELLSVDADPVDEQLIVEEKRRAVRTAVEAMPEKLREMLILAYYHHFPYKDIADVVGVPLGTVKSRLHAAVVAFRSAYEAVVVEQSQREGSHEEKDD